jgi:hypothetical protein
VPAFKATYDNFGVIGEDVSEIMLLLAARETPFLDLLEDADQPASNVYHQWREEYLGPDKITNSTAINSATANSGYQINGFGNQLQVGMLLEVEAGSPQSNEIQQIVSIAGPNSILCSRNFGGRGVSSLAAGGQLFIISTAELEGSETSGDVTRPRAGRGNYTQIFKKPVTVSGSDRAVVTAPDIGDEFDHQATLRAIELLRDLEKAVFRSVASGASIGGASQYRTMDGLRQWLTAINSTIPATSFAANPLDFVNDLLQQAWNAGARDLNVLACGDQWKRELSGTNAAKLQIPQNDRGIVRKLDYIETDFGVLQMVLTPWLPSRHVMGVSTQRVKVVNLRGRSFAKELLAKTGDSTKGHVLGEYTLEVHHPDKMFQAHT